MPDGNLLDITIDGFEWDEENINHLARHDVTPDDVEAAYEHKPLFLENTPSQTATHVMIAPDTRGRVLFVAILETAAPGVWRAIPGWESRAARRMYQQRGT